MLDASEFRCRVSRKQNCFASGQNLRECKANFSVGGRRDGLGRASAVANPYQSLPKDAQVDASVLAPARTVEDADVTQRDHRAAFHGDLVQLASAGFESDPLTVGREEGYNTHRSRKLRGFRLIQPPGE